MHLVRLFFSLFLSLSLLCLISTCNWLWLVCKNRRFFLKMASRLRNVNVAQFIPRRKRGFHFITHYGYCRLTIDQPTLLQQQQHQVSFYFISIDEVSSKDTTDRFGPSFHLGLNFVVLSREKRRERVVRYFRERLARPCTQHHDKSIECPATGLFLLYTGRTNCAVLWGVDRQCAILSIHQSNEGSVFVGR